MCGCNKNKKTVYRLTRPGGASADFSTLAEAQTENNSQHAGKGVIRTAVVTP